MTDNDDDDGWKDKKTNKSNVIGQRHSHELRHGQKKDKDDSDRHPAEVSLIGATLVSFGMGMQSPSFIGLFYLGFTLSLVDLPKLLGKDESTLSKLLSSHTLYYTAGGVGASIFFHGLGYPMPPAEFGMLADITLTTAEFLARVTPIL